MTVDARRQSLQIITALQTGDHPAIATIVGNLHDAFGDPAIVLGLNLQIGQGVARMGIKTGRYDDQLRRKGFQSR